ncbi:MAG: hypothetical protein LBB61_05355 [Treponema sp.]|nr:hypothetical protein [Treponema sp.]
MKRSEAGPMKAFTGSRSPAQPAAPPMTASRTRHGQPVKGNGGHGGIHRRIGGCGQGGEERRLSRLVRSPLLSAARCASR